MRSNKKAFMASMTVEASIALPLFIFFFVNIMVVFNIVKVQSDMEAALHQTGSEMSLMAFDLRFGEGLLGDYEGSELDMVAGAGGILYAKEMVRDYLGKGLEGSCVKDGVDGISFINSRVLLGNDYIDLVMDYDVKPMIPIAGFKEFPVEARFFGHAWTGYDIETGFGTLENEEEMVYVTEHGEVYHKSIDCEHLHLKAKSVDISELKKVRNKDRKIYYPCEYCGENIGAGSVFITSYGERYHSTLSCPGLKRKIYTIPISQVGGKRPCSTCGQ